MNMNMTDVRVDRVNQYQRNYEFTYIYTIILLQKIIRSRARSRLLESRLCATDFRQLMFLKGTNVKSKSKSEVGRAKSTLKVEKPISTVDSRTSKSTSALIN
jgi:hypothetical protein